IIAPSEHLVNTETSKHSETSSRTTLLASWSYAGWLRVERVDWRWYTGLVPSGLCVQIFRARKCALSRQVCVSTPYSSQRPQHNRSTLRLQEMTQADQDTVYHAPRAPDWLWLSIFALVVLGCGVWVWAQLGIDSEAGRAVFFGA